MDSGVYAAAQHAPSEAATLLMVVLESGLKGLAAVFEAGDLIDTIEGAHWVANSMRIVASPCATAAFAVFDFNAIGSVFSSFTALRYSTNIAAGFIRLGQLLLLWARAAEVLVYPALGAKIEFYAETQSRPGYFASDGAFAAYWDLLLLHVSENNHLRAFAKVCALRQPIQFRKVKSYRHCFLSNSTVGMKVSIAMLYSICGQAIEANFRPMLCAFGPPALKICGSACNLLLFFFEELPGSRLLDRIREAIPSGQLLT